MEAHMADDAKADKSRAHSQQDPAALISHFDARFQEIQDILAGKVVALKPPKQQSQQHPGSGGTSHPSHSSEHRVRTLRDMVEPPFMEPKPQKVMVLGTPISRSLADKIHSYRTDTALKNLLKERVQKHLEVKAEQEATEARQRANGNVQINFIRSNVRSLSAVLPSTMLAHGLALVGHDGPAPASAWSSSSPGASRPASSSGGRTRPASSSGYMPRPASSRPARPSTSGGAPSSARELLTRSQHATAAPPGAHQPGAPPPRFSGVPPPLTAPAHGDPWAASSVDPPAATAAIAQSATAAPNDTHSRLVVTWRDAGSPPDASDPSCSKHVSTASGATACLGSSSRGHVSTQRPWSAAAPCAHVPGWLSALAASNVIHDPQAAVNSMRQLRASLSSRPASGGSPSSRQEFMAERSVMCDERRLHQLAVRERRSELMHQAALRREGLAELRVRRQAEDEAKKLDERYAEVLQYRQVHWLGIVSTARRLTFLRRVLLEQRDERAVTQLRKDAAVKIATWYKRLLLRERHRKVIGLVMKLRRLLGPCVAYAAEKARVRCAERVALFLRCMLDANLAVVSVRAFMQKVVKIQRAWRTTVCARHMQRSVVLKRFINLEKAVIKHNMNPTGHPGSHAPARKGHRKGHADGGDVKGRKLLAGEGGGEAWAGGDERGSEDGADPDLDRQLERHFHALPRELREQIIDGTLHAERKAFGKDLDDYRRAKTIYMQQKPIEEIRMQLLRDAGIKPEAQLKPPRPPHFHWLMNRRKYKIMLCRGVEIIEQQRLADLEVQRRSASGAEGGPRAGSSHRARSSPTPPPATNHPQPHRLLKAGGRT